MPFSTNFNFTASTVTCTASFSSLLAMSSLKNWRHCLLCCIFLVCAITKFLFSVLRSFISSVSFSCSSFSETPPKVTLHFCLRHLSRVEGWTIKVDPLPILTLPLNSISSTTRLAASPSNSRFPSVVETPFLVLADAQHSWLEPATQRTRAQSTLVASDNSDNRSSSSSLSSISISLSIVVKSNTPVTLTVASLSMTRSASKFMSPIAIGPPFLITNFEPLLLRILFGLRTTSRSFCCAFISKLSIHFNARSFFVSVSSCVTKGDSSWSFSCNAMVAVSMSSKVTASVSLPTLRRNIKRR